MPNSKDENEKGNVEVEKFNAGDLKGLPTELAGAIGGAIKRAKMQRLAQSLLPSLMPNLSELNPYDEVVRDHLKAMHQEAQIRKLDFSSYLMILSNHSISNVIGSMSSYLESEFFDDEIKKDFSDISPVEIAGEILKLQIDNIVEGIRMAKGEIEKSEVFHESVKEAEKYCEENHKVTTH